MSAIVDAVRSALGEAVLGADAGFGSTTLDVAPARWADAARAARDAGATYFDMLAAYDLEADGFAVVAHLSRPDAADHLLLRTRVDRDAPQVPTLVEVYAGAAWHEREAHEMLGVSFAGHEPLAPLLLDPSAPATPLRKDVLLVARPSTPWPGDKDPADSTGRPRRRTPPPGVPADRPREGA
ncbi:MAG TPA: NADH-quinone oxidoreductase subunit C [Candidatus Nanopelagicales bacterium]|nr:NADH-quinone oxidoreductase subunit C [Candidatus Nanopelagicales bacterium]